MIRKAKKSLIKSNPYLRDSKQRQSQFIKGVISSTSIEGVFLSSDQIKKKPKSSTTKQK